MTAPHTAMVLAAGFGTRMGALTANTPKPLLPVRGRPLIDHALERCAEGGAGRAVVNLHYLGSQIREHLTAYDGIKIEFSEETEILETGGGLVQAAPLLGDDPVYTINSDAIWTGAPPLPLLSAAWDPARMDALLLLVRRENALGYTRAGDFFENDGVIRRRGEAPEAPYVYSGAQIFAPTALKGAPAGAFSLNVIWDQLLESGRLFGIVYEGGWVDVGTPEGLALADEALS